MTKADEKRWCILRTSGGRTLPLADSLIRHGIEAWSPRQTQVRRRPRSHLTFDIEVAIAPTFVLAAEVHLPALRAITLAPVSDHPPFSIFQHAGRIPIIGDHQVRGLRAEEHRLQEEVRMRTAARERAAALGERRAKERLIPVGQLVSIGSGAFAGMTGIVEGGTKKLAFVNLGFSVPLKIETWRFAEDIVCTDPAHIGTAAVAA